MKHYIVTFYKFGSLSDARISEIKASLEANAQALGVEGLMILGREGLNSTVTATSPENLKVFYEKVQQIPEIGIFEVKESVSDVRPFRRFKVDIREEIVTLGTPDLVPDNRTHHHLPPEEWEKALHEPGVVCIDTRNRYETKVGKFKNAIDPEIDEFTQFPEAVQKLNLPKDQKILIYCTGGIRCEKAILELERQGFNNVWQLEGGILRYLEKMPYKSWEGECFVFDHRVAVDQELRPSKTYAMCPHCGDPTSNRIDCVRCDEPAAVCDKCLALGLHKRTCSKNCAHHYLVKPVKGRRQILEPLTRKSLENPAPRPPRSERKVSAQA